MVVVGVVLILACWRCVGGEQSIAGARAVVPRATFDGVHQSLMVTEATTCHSHFGTFIVFVVVIVVVNDE